MSGNRMGRSCLGDQLTAGGDSKSQVSGLGGWVANGAIFQNGDTGGQAWPC